MNDDVINYVKKLCIEHDLEIDFISNNYIRINTDEASGLSLFVNIDIDNKISFYYLVRTHDVFYDGDRSDAHVVLSLMFGVYLKTVQNISTSLFDIAHPVIQGEIYGRYIVPQQVPFQLKFANQVDLREILEKIIIPIFIWRSFFWLTVGCPCNECWKDKESEKNNHNYELSEELKTLIKEFSGETNYGSRVKPKYEYFYNFDNEITIIKSNDLSVYLKKMFCYPNHSLQELDGINGKLIIDGDIKNIIHHHSIKDIKQIRAKLKVKPTKFNIVALENMLIVNSHPYIIALGRLSGLEEFNPNYAVDISRDKSIG